MEKIELKRTEFIFIIDGVEHKVRRPNVKEVIDLSKKENIESDFEGTLGLLERLGLPKAVSLGLDTEHIETIVTALLPKKKA